MFKFVDSLSFTMLIFISILMLLAPFKPMPHVVEKIIMLKNGELKKGIDILDLFYHFVPTFLLIIKTYRFYKAN
ncbi:hypothetical protein R9X47_27920 [Wukongibacter baidiensis]|uniref:hypothetical protein n=1 Tax=Wukongibacter baidiensis TaxID=1723361 RepID=UPI003D7F52DD